MVASAKTVPSKSPIASESWSFLTAEILNNNSGITVPNPIKNKPITAGLIVKYSAIFTPDSTIK